MKRWLVGGIVSTAAAVAMLVPATTALSDGWSWDKGTDKSDLVSIGLVDGKKLVKFTVDRPWNTKKIGEIKNLKRGDKKIVGIDFRVQNGKLYGVGDGGGIYILSTRDARATFVSQLTVALNGRFFGVDFNPAANRLRVISDTGQNLRHNIDDPAGAPPAGTTATDTSLSYSPTTTPLALGVTGAAYTNNDLDPKTATTLFDIDTNLDQTSIQSPANSGQLAPTGMLGVNAGTNAGFDIYSVIRWNKVVDAKGFATLKVDGKFQLFRINLLTGSASNVGSFPRQLQVSDLALPLNQR